MKTAAAAVLAAGIASAVTGSGAQEPVRVVILGDSITTGYGLAAEHSLPAVLRQWAATARTPIEIAAAARSGDTTGDARGRMGEVVALRPDVIVIAVGGNDGLQGLDTGQMAVNLEAIVRQGQATGAQVVLTGMEALPQYGAAYTAAFRNVFHQLGRTPGVLFMPFLLNGVAGNPALNQRDRIHPNARGAALIARNLWPYIEAAARQSLRTPP